MEPTAEGGEVERGCDGRRDLHGVAAAEDGFVGAVCVEKLELTLRAAGAVWRGGGHVEESHLICPGVEREERAAGEIVASDEHLEGFRGLPCSDDRHAGAEDARGFAGGLRAGGGHVGEDAAETWAVRGGG